MAAIDDGASYIPNCNGEGQYKPEQCDPDLSKIRFYKIILVLSNGILPSWQKEVMFSIELVCPSFCLFVCL